MKIKSTISLYSVCGLGLLLFMAPNAYAQTGGPEPYAEYPDDPYIHVPKEDRPGSPAYLFTSANFTIRQVNVNGNGDNMLGDAANEPSMAIDPVNPLRMAIGWREFETISSNFRQAGYAYTGDGGETWAFPGPLNPGVFRSDPVLDADTEGNFYYNSLKSDFTCDVFRSTVPGSDTWDAGTFAHGGDKQWMVVDRTNGPTNGNIYAFWKSSYTSCGPGFFTRSLDNGLSYEDCIEVPGDPTRGTLAIGPDAALYACGGIGNTFVVARSSNAGLAGQDLIWDYSRFVDLGGPLSIYSGPNPGGMLGQVWVAVDNSDGPFRGYVYLLATVNSTSTGDPADIMFARSTDGGDTWGDPVRINDDLPNDNWQWFGTLSVAPSGRIDVAWVDTRDNPGSFDSALYYSWSLDGGETWSQNEKLSEAFDPHLGWPQQSKLGDYYHSVSDENGMHLAWAATFNGEQDVFYSYIQPELPVSAVRPVLNVTDAVLSQNTPNPFRDFTRIPYSIKTGGKVRLEIFDLLGQSVKVLTDEEKPAGDYAATWDSRDAAGMSVHGGVYFYRLLLDGNLVGVGKGVMRF